MKKLDKKPRPASDTVRPIANDDLRNITGGEEPPTGQSSGKRQYGTVQV